MLRHRGPALIPAKRRVQSDPQATRSGPKPVATKRENVIGRGPRLSCFRQSPTVIELRRLVRVPLGSEHDRRDALVEVAPEIGPHGLRPRPLGRGHGDPKAAVVSGEIEEEAPDVAEHVVTVGLKLRGPLGLPVNSYSLILPVLATQRSPLFEN